MTAASDQPFDTLPSPSDRWLVGWRLAPQVGEMLRRTSWRQRTLLVLAVVVPFAFAALFAAHQRAEVIAAARDDGQRSALALEQHSANVIDTHSLILRQLNILVHGRSWEQIRNDPLLRMMLSEFSRDLTQISTIGITDAGGNLITNAADIAADGVSIGDRDYFLAHKRGPAGLFVSEAYTARASGQRLFAISIRRTSPSGEFAGVIFTAVPLEHFINFWRGFTPSGGHLIPMVRPDGALIVRYPHSDSPQHLDPRGPFISNLTRSPKGVYTAVSLVDGIERINAYTQVKNYPLFISFSVETDMVLQGWRHQVIAAAAIATVVAALLIALWLVAVRQSHIQAESLARWQAAAHAVRNEVALRQQAEESMRQGAERATFGEQLIGIVSHDLRNPLNTISLTAAVMARRDTLGAQDAKFVQRIQNASQRAANLIGDLLDFTQARLGGRIPVKARPTNLHDLLRSVLVEIEAAHPDRIAIALEAQSPQGEWDPDRLSQVVENLVVNALKYGAPGGTVRVSTRSDDSSVMIDIHNDGVPIPPEQVAVIFEPLHRAAEVSQPNPDRSIGIGLYIVKHIVEAHGGTIGVDSVAERGTTFTVRLPLAR